MAVARADSGTAFTFSNVYASSITLSTFTVSTGSNLVLLVGIALGQGGGSNVTTTWNGVTLSSEATVSSGSNNTLRLFSLVNPDAGNQNLVATWVGSLPATIGAAAFSGVHQTTPLVTSHTVSTAGTSTIAFTGNVSSDAAGATFAVASLEDAAGSAGDFTSTNTFTEEWRQDSGSGGEVATVGSSELGGTANDHQFTLDASRNYATIGVHLKSADPPTAAVTGTATASITETDVVNGGKTVIVTVSSDTYVNNSTIPVSYVVGDTLDSGSNTASTVWFVSTQGVSTNDLVIYHIGWDDSTTVTGCTASTAPSGQNISTLIGPVASLNTEVRSQVYWLIATTSWAASTTRFDPSAAESWTATVLRIPAGEFNSSSPFGSMSSYNANTSTGTTVSSPSFSCTTSDAIGRLIAFNVIDTDPVTAVPAGWQSTNLLDLGAVTHCLSYRTSTVAASESIASESWTIAGDSSVTHSYILNAYAQNDFDAQRQNFINGIDSAQSEANGWDAVVKAGQHVSTVVRTSDTVVTMTLSAYASFNITAQETITVSVPAGILTGGEAIVATPTFTIDVAGGAGPGYVMYDKMLLLGVT